LIAEYRKHIDPIDTSSIVEVREARAKIKAQLTKWMPMEKGILGMVVAHLPSPRLAQESKLSIICPSLLQPKPPKTEDSSWVIPSPQEEWDRLREAVIGCKNGESAPAIAYVTKMQPVSSRLYDVVTRS
jgi:translation elongation factor EF-G